MLLRVVVTIAFSLSLAVGIGHGQNPQVSKDQAELQTYTLTMDTVTHVMQATRALSEYAKKHPELKSAANSPTSQTIDGMSGRLASIPGVTGILATYNLTPRTYSVATLCFAEIGMAMAAVNAGAKSNEVITKLHINPANIKLLQTHKGELQELSRKYSVQDSSN